MMDWLIWQLADSAFPSGGFAHSGGLEAAWQQGEVENLEYFVRQVITQCGHAALPFVGAAHEGRADLAELDALCDAFLSSAVANRASRIQGVAFLMAAERAFPRVLESGSARELRLAMHYAPIFGTICGLIGVERRTAQALFLQIACRGVLAAAVRLGIIGSNAAQRLQSELAPHLQETLERCADLSPAQLAQTAPLIDLWQSMHDRLYSRLFQS
ncbi:MAG: urease accessory protein UreF [Thermoanaerobaculia bacterium]